MSKEAEEYWRKSYKEGASDNFKVMQSYAEHYYKHQLKKDIGSVENLKALIYGLQELTPYQKKLAQNEWENLISKNV